MEPKTYIHTDSKVKALQYSNGTASIAHIHKWVVASGGSLSIKTMMSTEASLTGFLDTRTSELIVKSSGLGEVVLRDGDWLIKGEGLFESWPADRFARKYELHNAPAVEENEDAFTVKRYTHQLGGTAVVALRYYGSHRLHAVLNFLQEKEEFSIRYKDNLTALILFNQKTGISLSLEVGDWVAYDGDSVSAYHDDGFTRYFFTE